MAEHASDPKPDLVEFLESDISTLVRWIPDQEFLCQWTANVFEWPLTVEQILQHYERSTRPDSKLRIFKAVDRSGSMIGYIELNRIDPLSRSAALCRILVGPSGLRGQGVGTEMIQRVLKIAFEKYKLHRIELSVYSRNERAIRCYERIGFRQEGLSRDCVRIGQSWGSEYRMSILEDEWRGLQSPGSET